MHVIGDGGGAVLWPMVGISVGRCGYLESDSDPVTLSRPSLDLQQKLVHVFCMPT
jgi:hypothetical protein